MRSPSNPLGEVTLVYVAVAAATVGLVRLGQQPRLSGYVPLAISALFLLTATWFAQREPGGMRRFGIDLAGVLAAPEDEPSGIAGLRQAFDRALPAALRESLWALRVACLVFPLFTVAYWLWFRPTTAFRWQLAPDVVAFFLSQLIVVALPEEALFRGYFMSRLQDRWPNKQSVLGTAVSTPALLTQAVLFGCLHVAVDGQPGRLSVALPGLLFGWMKARRAGIGAASMFHAMCNVYSDFLARNWL